MKATWPLAILSLAAAAGGLSLAGWKPARGHLSTRWAKDVSPDHVHPEYPRPQMVRKQWHSLNGLWDHAITAREAPRPRTFDGKILVPFAVESALSGVGKTVGKDKRLWYRRTFALPASPPGGRLLLHFGAVDWEAVVWVNGKEVASHRGGYDPFSCDLTDAVDRGKEKQEIVVAVWDPTDEGLQPRGKQVNRPNSIWYTPVTGIWQTVWLEPVPAASIAGLRLVPDVDARTLTVTATVAGPRSAAVRVAAPALKASASGKPGAAIRLDVSGAKLWSPSDPRLYDLTVELIDGGKAVDRVASYFGMRKVALGKDENGITRVLLNGEPLFQYGPLDQGWWPDGLYTAPTDGALRHDLEVTRRLGFNMVRKHVKVEPARWYHHCDRLGLLVWQDMPSGGPSPAWPLDGAEARRPADSAKQYDRELAALVESRYNHPCIVAWVPFNEAWGQFDTVRVTRRVQQLDPTRLVISASGGNDFGVGAIHDIHDYPGPLAPPAQSGRAVVLGEFGGLGLPLKGHTWQNEKNWGYRSYTERAPLEEAYLRLVKNLRPLIESRLSAAVYTQTTDVEIEVNGLMTYDRAVLKFDEKKLTAAHKALYAPLRKLTPAERSRAHTLAYWRFEGGKAGTPVPHDRARPEGVAAPDVSGNRNHLYAYSADNAPRAGADVPGPVVPLLGLPNRGSLDDSAAATAGSTRDLYTDRGRSGASVNVLDTFALVGWTVEASVKPALLGATQTIVGKDGRPTAGKHAPLQLQLRKDDRLALVAIDGTGAVREVAGRDPVKLGRWYNVAVTSDGKAMRLYLHDGRKYVLQNETAFDGGLALQPGTWTVGRGHHDGRHTFDARASIDEVRISAAALPDELLLWSAPAAARK